jgi:hypothetical protein
VALGWGSNLVFIPIKGPEVALVEFVLLSSTSFECRFIYRKHIALKD